MTQAWTWLLIGFVISTGIANAMLSWASALRVGQARWAASVNRIGQSALFFVPVAIVALIVLLIGIGSWAPWVRHPVPLKVEWLNVRFFVIREIALLGAFWILCFFMVRSSLKADAASEEITSTQHGKLNALAAVTVAVYAIASSVVAYDFIMSLAPDWVSTMFGPYYFCTNMYAGMAVIIMLAAALRSRPGAEKHLTSSEFHDMGNLMLAFSLFDMGLFFAQYLTIWYGNLPEETGFIIGRYYRGTWPYLGWAAFIVGYAIPFIFLQSRKLKENPRLLSPVAALVVIGVALERYVLIAPSFYPSGPTVSLSVIIPIALLAALLVSVMVFLRRYSPVSLADAALAHLPNPEEPI